MRACPTASTGWGTFRFLMMKKLGRFLLFPLFISITYAAFTAGQLLLLTSQANYPTVQPGEIFLKAKNMFQLGYVWQGVRVLHIAAFSSLGKIMSVARCANHIIAAAIVFTASSAKLKSRLGDFW